MKLFFMYEIDVFDLYACELAGIHWFKLMVFQNCAR